MNTRHLLAAAFCCASTVPYALAEMQSPQSPRHILNLDDVEINTLIEDVSMVTGYTFIVHPDVRKKRVTVTSQKPMSSNDVFEVFLSTLRVHGFTAVPSGRDTYRIVPEQSAVGQAGLYSSGPNQVVTEIVKLDYFSAIEAAQMVKPLVDTEGQVVASKTSNTLVVVDYASNMSRIRELVKSLDQDKTLVETVHLKHVPSTEMAKILNELSREENKDQFKTSFSAVPSETSNSIVLRGESRDVDRAMKVAQRLDASDPVQDNIRVVSLNNTDADQIVPILERVGASLVAKRGPAAGAISQPTISHHEQTNSLVISADSEMLLAMDRIIEALDTRRSQVLVEAIIVELSDTTARELGVEFLLAGTDSTSVPLVSTNFSRSAPNLLAIGGAIAEYELSEDDASLSSGSLAEAAISSLLSLNGGTIGVGGQSGDTLFGAVLTAVQDDTASNILSTPSIMTMDNAPAEILVGQQIPITTGEVLGDSNSNPFRTVEREDVGVKLQVTPRIGEDGTVRLDIYQEVSSIFGSIGDTTTDFITNERQFSTSVLAENGEMIVIGGLIEQQDTTTATKVPLLGDIPVMGNLFKSEGRGLSRTNLMVFIKPTVIRDNKQAAMTTAQKYRYIQAEELMREQNETSSLDAFLTDVVGITPPR